MLDRNSDGVDFDVCVVGLGYVGLTLATAFAHHGLVVAGTERVPAVVETLRRGDSSFYEQGLSEVLTDVVARRQLQVFAADEPLPKAGAYVITVGTPLRDGEVHFTDLENALDTVAAQMPAGALIVLRSTVRIGITENTAKPVLDRAGKPYLLAMAPERTVEGRALQELSSLPQVVGGIDAASTAAANELFAHLGVEIVEVGNTKAAEFAKLVSNTWRDLQFGFANELAYLADASGVDIYEVITAAGYKYDRLKLALPGPVAGPCLEKDAYILADSAQFFDTEVPLSLAGRTANEKIVTHVGQTAQTFRSWRGVLCVLVPLTVVSILCNALMSLLGIGLKVSTLPVIPLGVGVGVDYGVYIYERLQSILRRDNLPLREAYYQALKQRGTAAAFTALTMSIGVATWAMSSLKFQADMGVLLAFMFLVNVLGAIFVLPALAYWLGVGRHERQAAADTRLEPATQGGA